MVGMSGGSEVVGDANARQFKIFARLFAHKLFWSFWSRPRFLLRRFRRFHLRFDVLAFPAPRHIYSLTQVGPTVGDSYGKVAKNQAPAARCCGRTGRAGRITPRMVLSATRARCSAKTPRYEKTAVWLPQLTRRDQRPWNSSAHTEVISPTGISRNE